MQLDRSLMRIARFCRRHMPASYHRSPEQRNQLRSRLRRETTPTNVAGIPPMPPVEVPSGFRRCTFECRQLLPLDDEHFYPLKGGGFTPSCRKCQQARKSRRNQRRGIGRYSDGLDALPFDDVEKVARAVSVAVGRLDPNGAQENEFARAIDRVMRRYPNLNPRMKARVLNTQASKVGAAEPRPIPKERPPVGTPAYWRWYRAQRAEELRPRNALRMRRARRQKRHTSAASQNKR